MTHLLKYCKKIFTKKILFVAMIFFSSIIAFLPVRFPDNISDKFLHFLAFMVISGMGLMIFKRVKLVIFYMIVYGIFIEFVQIFIPNRTPSFLDFAGDVFGIFAGFCFYLII